MKSNKSVPVPFFPWQRFSFKFFSVLVVPLLVIIFGVLFFSQNIHLREMKLMVGDRNLKITNVIANNINQIFQNKKKIFLFYQNEFLETKILPQNMSDFDLGLFLINQASENPFSGIPVNLSEGTKSILLNLQPGSQDLILFENNTSEPVGILASFTEEGVLLGIFRLTPIFDEVLPSLNFHNNYSVVIANEQNIFYQMGIQSFLHNSQETTLVNQGVFNGTGVNYISTPKEDLIIAFAPIPNADLVLIIEETWQNVFSTVANTTLYIPFILFPLLLLSIIALWYGAKNIIHPLQKLQEQANMLGNNDFEAIYEPVGGIEEIRDLQENLIKMAEDLHSAQTNLQKYIGAITASVENERKNLARELHDETLQNLIAIQQQFNLLQIRLFNNNLHDNPEIVSYKNFINDSIHNLRRTLQGLRPAYLEDLGLASGLRSLTKEVELNNNLSIHFSLKGIERRLKPEIDLALYRITQEALNNIIHHANATNVNISLEYTTETVLLRIEDNGIGFNVPAKKDTFAGSGHFGLLGMFERAELVNAQLSINSTPGNGCKVSVFKNI